MTQSIEDKIIAARAGDLIVGIRSRSQYSITDAATEFGLFPEAKNYREVDGQDAEAILTTVLAEDLAYNCERVPRAEAEQLAADFIHQFDNEPARFYTNIEFGESKNALGGWTPVTDATFDAGVLIVSPTRIACAWFMDED